MCFFIRHRQHNKTNWKHITYITRIYNCFSEPRGQTITKAKWFSNTVFIVRQRSTQQGMNPVHTLFVHSGGLRANVFVSNAKIPFLVHLHVAEYLARFVHAVQWILLGIHEFFGTRLKSDFSIINTLPRRTCWRDMALSLVLQRGFISFACLLKVTCSRPQN